MPDLYARDNEFRHHDTRGSNCVESWRVADICFYNGDINVRSPCMERQIEQCLMLIGEERVAFCRGSTRACCETMRLRHELVFAISSIELHMLIQLIAFY